MQTAPSRWRSIPYSVARAAQRWLTGQRCIPNSRAFQTRRYTGSRLAPIQTFTQQTPDPERVLAELRTVVPADIMLDYQVTFGATWEDLVAYATWDDLAAAIPIWSKPTAAPEEFISWEQ